MAEESANSVGAAFEILLEEIEEEIDLTNRVGSEAFSAGEHDRAGSILADARQLIGFRDRVAGLQREWEAQHPVLVEDEQVDEITGQRREFGRVPKGARTPHRAFYRPILQVVSEMGGSARAGDVIDAVGPRMKGTLKEIEYTPLSSQPDEPRWRNRTHWARHQLVQEGLLKGDSDRGTWEISDEGRRWLEEQNDSSS